MKRLNACPCCDQIDEMLNELKRQHRRLRGLISELEKMPDHEQAGMTILDLDEIQAAIGHCLYWEIFRQGDAGAPASP